MVIDRSALFSAGPLAERIAIAAGVNPKAILRSLRKHMAERTILASVVPHGGTTSPNLFNELFAYRAALAFKLSRLGLSDDMVKSAVQFMDYDEGEKVSEDDLWSIIENLPNRAYFFHVIVFPDYFETPGQIRFGTFSSSSDAKFSVPGGIDAWATTITISLRGLLADLNQSDEDRAVLPPRG
jgi:hypothetical protein